MKSFITVTILVLMVAGITFVTQVLSVKKEADATKPPDTPPERGLVLPKTQSETIYSEMAPTSGFCDYYWVNPMNNSLDVGLEMKSCKCTGVEIRNLNPLERETYLRSTPAGAVAQTFGAAPLSLGCLTTGAALRNQLQPILGPSGDWVSLMDKDPKLTVPPEGTGLLRLRYEGKTEGPQRLKAVIWSEPVGRFLSRTYTPVELPMLYVKPLIVQPPDADIKELSSGGHRSIGFICFSATRMDYSLKARPEHDDPCVEAKCEPITPEEAAKYLEESGDKIPLLGCYLVKVTVHENRNGRQLDFGPFRRRIILSSDAIADQAVLVVKGSVASDLRVVGEKHNQVSLETFDADKGVEKAVPIESDRPGLKLQLETHAPEVLQVDLGKPEPTPSGGQQWKLVVKVPANRLHGLLPVDSEIVLKTQDTPPRRFRIPVVGHAVVK